MGSCEERSEWEDRFLWKMREGPMLLGMLGGGIKGDYENSRLRQTVTKVFTMPLLVAKMATAWRIVGQGPLPVEV